MKNTYTFYKRYGVIEVTENVYARYVTPQKKGGI